MSKQLIPPVKGTRDFYPEDFAFREWLYGKIKEVSYIFGYQEFDGPEIEYLDLYADKTSQEILKEQVFTLKDRDGRDLALRPELTPTLSRMIAQKSQQMQKPIRWFSFGRAWRYEQPQKGRGREFFQWEIDILGVETPEADAEIIAIAATFFQKLGLTAEEVVIRVSDRSYFDQVLSEVGIDKAKFMPLLRIVDRKEKISQEEFEQALQGEGLNPEQITKLNDYFTNPDYSKSPSLSRLFTTLKAYPGVIDYVQYDPTIARGFEYYTGTVFEAWDKTGGLRRALFGGGRFDNLTATLGGEKIAATGMAPGDMPIRVLLEQFQKMPELKPVTAQVLVTVFSEELFSQSLQLSSMLRESKITTELWPDPTSKLDKQLKYADQRGIDYVVIIGPEEAQANQVVLKNLQQRTQETVSFDQLVEKLVH